MTKTIEVDCAGMCGVLLNYTLFTEAGKPPRVEPPHGLYSFLGGHLCHGCAKCVVDAMARRRLDIAREAAAQRKAHIPTVPA